MVPLWVKAEDHSQKRCPDRFCPYEYHGQYVPGLLATHLALKQIWLDILPTGGYPFPTTE
jgi:hypothetical protein